MASVRVRQDGSICIPADIRYRHGIRGGVVVQVKVNQLGQFVLTPEKFKCSCCGMTLRVVDKITGMCDACTGQVTNYVREGMSFNQAVARVRKSR